MAKKAQKSFTEEIHEDFGSGDLIKTNADMRLHRPTITLPSYDSLSEDAVMKEMKAVFKGMEFDTDWKVEQRFKTIEQLENYAKASKEEIDTFDDQFKRSAIKNNGAISARRWQFGYVISKCLASKAYGTGMAEKLAAASGYSVPYIYQFKNVGENLSMKDAYILGLYGAGWDSIRELATIEDPLDRQLIIKKFVESIPDYNDGQVRKRAQAALAMVISSTKNSSSEPLDVSNAARIEANLNLNDLAPEYVETMKMLKKFDAVLAKVSKETFYEDLTRSLERCYIGSNIVGAEDKLQDMKAVADSCIKKCKAAKDFMDGAITQLESVSHMEVMKAEE